MEKVTVKNNDYTITGNDIKTYILIRKGLVHENVQESKFSKNISTRSGIKVDVEDGWVAYELGMLRMLQYSSKQDVKPIIVMTSDHAKGNAKGRSVTSGRLVFRNTSIGVLGDLKRRILTDDRFKIQISSTGFGVDFEEDITSQNIDKSEVIEDTEEVSWQKMPPMDLLLVASDERDIEMPRVMRFKDISIGDTGSSIGSTDTEENEFCNFLALSGFTPFRTLEPRIYK